MFYFVDSNRITVYFSDTSVATWDINDSIAPYVKELCMQGKEKELENIVNFNSNILNKKVTVDKNVSVDGKKVDSKIDTPIVKFIKLLKAKGVVDKDIEHIKPFIKNMFDNPFIDAVTEIYDFIKKLDLEITDDGCFLAYKKVNKDLTSIYDGKTQHVIGEYTEEKYYDTDRTIACSKGLHFCSKDYLKNYSPVNTTTICVKVNPKDVVAIPLDHDFEKGRCRKYMTVGIIPENKSITDMDVDNYFVNVTTAKEFLNALLADEDFKKLIKKYVGAN